MVMHSLAVGSLFGARALHGKQYQWKCAIVIFQSLLLLGVLWLGFFLLLIVMPSRFSFLRLNFLGGLDVVLLCVGRGWILMHVRTIVWVGGIRIV